VHKRFMYFSVILLCLVLLVGCGAKKQRQQILANQDKMMQQQDKIITGQESMSSSNKEFQENAKKDLDALLTNTKASSANDEQILSIVKDTNQQVTDANLAKSLDQIYKEIYGVGTDLRMAVGETRIVVAVKNDQPLRVHAEIPTSATADNIVAKLPIGTLLFNCQQITDTWWKGAILKEREKVEVVFAVKYTEPLRNNIAPSLIETAKPEK